MLKIILLVVSINLIKTNIRFHDEELLKEHHNHIVDDVEQELNIHLIPHSHDDIGWLKTVDEYYYGLKQGTQWAAVQYILDTVVEELIKDPAKRFVQVEVGFFFKWWLEQSSDTQEKVKVLVQKKQLEFINGGWCMNDEAATYYEDIIDQMTVGHQFLLNTFGVIPTIGWHIDPFGHSSAQASIFSQMGFNAWFFARIDHQDKQQRLLSQGMEMLWKPFSQNVQDNYIFTHVNYYHYSPPPGFCFDTLCHDDPIIDNQKTGNNIEEKAQKFADYFRSMSVHYRTNELMHTMGDDFQFSAAFIWYKNLDKLIKYINSHKEKFNLNVFYSTPSQYVQAVNLHKETTFPEKLDDFFPYSDNPDSFWTGYFTSRVAIKGNTKQKGRFLQQLRSFLTSFNVIRQSNFLISNKTEYQQSLLCFEQAMATLQHHDGVSGTEKQHVSDDYTFILQNGSDSLHDIYNQVLKEQLLFDQDLTYCNWNSTAFECPRVYNALKNKQQITMVIYNAAVKRTQLLRVKVPRLNIKITDQSTANTLVGDIFCSNSTDLDDCDMFFYSNLLGYDLTLITLTLSDQAASAKVVEGKEIQKKVLPQFYRVSDTQKVAISLQNDVFYQICDFENKMCQTQEFKIEYNCYHSYMQEGQKSGAYIFRPVKEENEAGQSSFYTQSHTKIIFQGQLITQIQLISDKIEAVLRFYANADKQNVVEIESFIKSISIQNQVGKEIILRISTKINNQGKFYTDSNGLELIKRELFKRDTWNVDLSQKVSGNYYPVNLAIKINDTINEVTLVNDRSQGGSSLANGQLELMIHRRILKDDGRGVGDPLNETNKYNDEGLVQKVRHWLVFSSSQNDQTYRKIQFEQDLYPLIGYSTVKIERKNGIANKVINSIFPNGIPNFVKVFLQEYNFSSNTVILRVQNMLEVQTPSIPMTIRNIKETTLTFNQDIQNWKSNRLKWNGMQSTEDIDNLVRSSSSMITLKPLQMRVLMIEIA